MKKLMMVCIALTALLGMTNIALAQPYGPVGVQTNVPKSTVINGGWSECYSDLYENDGTTLSSIFAQCPGENLMLACSQVGGDEFVVLGQAPFADVTFDTGTGNVTHQANGIEWYFSEVYSWGFAPLGESVSRNSCDTAITAMDQRLCWHTGGGQIDGGWSCGTDRNLNGSSAWVRHVLINGDLEIDAVDSNPIPVNSNYALALLILLVGSIGFITIRRYH